MTKCDFCKMSSPILKCYWTSQALREEDCKKAIKKMTKVLSGRNGNKKNKKKENKLIMLHAEMEANIWL